MNGVIEGGTTLGMNNTRSKYFELEVEHITYL
ncbi:hypothetical protein PL2TA16_03215 [Pseudoalteromonas luteoviolacea 2ta16]|uniref:Uncharacterized protein n=1 Tax=Pseudoalteromonas luteoviolacea (strain 2ta16) TaxID=1353533 RepID=V4JEB0_PSEL2|nr:hypothetical protein PL2TA16_03215 [Pseudoalteromonas luteoviolacea 2ta16]